MPTRSCEDGQFYLGGVVDPASGKRTEASQCLDADQLTTHGVIVGMTGSGKTGLGVLLLEEALQAGIPTLVIDPKGDMGNLALRFPDLAPTDFEPWVAPEDARRAGVDLPTYAAQEASKWRTGLADWGIGPQELRGYRDAAEITIYTPGSGAGVPLNVLGSLAAPGLDPNTHGEVLADEVEGFVSGLLSLAGIESDPITSREHILLSNLVLNSWRQGLDLDIGQLIAQVQRPTMRKLGVFDLESFFPEKERMKLALRLNGLLASPAFAGWMKGEPLDIGSLLYTPAGRPRAAVVAMAHLSEIERQFVVTLLLSKVATWMQTQPGTSDLRALVYMDEVFGYAPPSAQPPSKKPILTLLKQARAFGVGLVLSTQNPVDLDYKAISNAGTWFIGRLQTERDRARLLDGLSAAGAMDKAALDDAIAGLDKRQFLLQRAGKAPSLFGTRWAMSYLRGPLTRHEIGKLGQVAGASTTAAGTSAPPTAPAAQPSATAAAPASSASASSTAPPATSFAAPAPAALGANESAQPPIVARNVKVAWLDPSATWSDAVKAMPGGKRYQAALAARVNLRFDERYSEVDHQETWEAVWFPLTERFDADDAIAVDYDDRDFDDRAPDGAIYVMPEAPIGKTSFFKEIERAILDELYRDREIEIFKNADLKLYSRVGESKEEFLRRCDAVAQDKEDEEAAKLRDKVESKLRTLQERLRAAERRVAELDEEVGARGREEWLSLGGDIIGAFLGGRSRTRSIASSVGRASRRRRMTSTTANRLDTAAEKVDAVTDDIQALEDDLVEELAAIDEKWAALAQQIDSMAIGLEKNDIDVDELTLVWVPRG
jgi:hypothetical protein